MIEVDVERWDVTIRMVGIVRDNDWDAAVSMLAYSDEFERRFQSIVNAGSDDFERAGVRRWWWFSFHFGSVRSRERSSP